MQNQKPEATQFKNKCKRELLYKSLPRIIAIPDLKAKGHTKFLIGDLNQNNKKANSFLLQEGWRKRLTCYQQRDSTKVPQNKERQLYAVHEKFIVSQIIKG